MIERTENTSRDHTIETAVSEPSRQMAVFGFALGAGSMSVLAGCLLMAYDVILGLLWMVIGGGVVGYGWYGRITMRQLLASFEPIILEQVREIQPEENQELVQAVTVSDNGGSMRLSKYRLTRQQWGEWARAIFDHDNRLVRRDVPDGVIKDITSAWPGVLKDLRRVGVIDDKNTLTPAGVTHFSKFAALPQLEEIDYD